MTQDSSRHSGLSTSEEWRPGVSLQAVRQRAELYTQVRDFFRQRDVLEVDTPLLSAAAATDPNIESLMLAEPRLYLQTSPEFAMKRLLASGSGSIYQIAKAFRGGESVRRHRPEFTMLEWYRVGFSYQQLMDEVADLYRELVADRPVKKVTYRELFVNQFNLDPHLVGVEELGDLADTHTGYRMDAQDDKDSLLDLLMSHLIEPQLGDGCLTFVYDYPAGQCALAQVAADQQGQPVAQRFELYADGFELANGYQELTDWREQERRFTADNIKRARRGQQQLPLDRTLLGALQHGLPECAGVALGLDRLLMLKLGVADIGKVL